MVPPAVGVDSVVGGIPNIHRHKLFRFFKVHDQVELRKNKDGNRPRPRQAAVPPEPVVSRNSEVCSEGFLLGTSISVYQNSGSPSPTNWGEFEKKKTFFGR